MAGRPFIPTTLRPGYRAGRRGFTLIETMICIVILGLVATSIFGVYASGLQTLDEQAQAELLESAARSRMERLLSTKFVWLLSGSQDVTIEGQTYQLSWTVKHVDLDGDSFADASAKQIVLSLEDLQLTTIVVNHNGDVGKL